MSWANLSWANLSWAEFVISFMQAMVRALEPVWLSPEFGSNEIFSRRAKRIISAPGIDWHLLIPVLAVLCQQWKQRLCADNTSCRTCPGSLARDREARPWQEEPAELWAQQGLSQLPHSNSVWDQSLLLSAQHHQQQCWKRMLRKCYLKLKCRLKPSWEAWGKILPYKKDNLLKWSTYTFRTGKLI